MTTRTTSSLDAAPFALERDAHGRLVHTDAAGAIHAGVTPVRAFPIEAPDEGVSMLSAEGRELAWIERLDTLPAQQRALLEEELAAREFVPAIRRLVRVSTFSTPSNWDVETDRGAARLVLKGEEDIRRVGRNALLITSGHGIAFIVPDIGALDRHSRRLLERFL